ncbi:hypothetical protein AS026_28235 [Rhizobium altiplani]|nr:hypothetical protein AS026_28235 [Rhizobium altiplani]
MPAQQYYAAFLDGNETWHEWLEINELNTLLAQFREQPCMNDPTKFINEIIQQDMTLYVYVNDRSTRAAATQDLNYIDDKFCFTGQHGEKRLLATDVPPWEMLSFSDLAAAHRSLGCDEVHFNSFRRCLVIPKTDFFWQVQEAPLRLWSRRTAGKFDVLAVTDVRGMN